MNTIYSKIKAIRIQKNLSQHDVGKMIGTNQSNYNRIESGLTQLTIERMEQIARAFEMTVFELMSFEGEGVENSEVAQYIKTIQDLETKIRKNQEKFDRERQEAEDIGEIIEKTRSEEVEKLKSQLKDRDEKIKKKDEIIKDKDEKIKERDDRLKEKDERLKDKDLVIDTLKMLINSKVNNND